MSVISEMYFERLKEIGLRPEWSADDGDDAIYIPHLSLHIYIITWLDDVGRVYVRITSLFGSPAIPALDEAFDKLNEKLIAAELPAYYCEYRHAGELQKVRFLYEGDEPPTDKLTA